MFDYLNLVEWFIALASLVAWMRFATFMAADVRKNLVDHPELPWQLAGMGVGVWMFVMYVAMPFFWLAFLMNLLVAGGMVAIFWTTRVKALGAKGHLFKGAIRAAANVSGRMEERRTARQVQLTYLRHDNTLMPLPKPDDPLAAGLGTADQIVIQALVRHAEVVDLAPSSSGYALTLVTDGVSFPQPPVQRQTAEAVLTALKVLAGLSAEERRRPQVGTFRSRDADGATTVWTVRTSGTTAGERAMLYANEQGRWDLPLDQLGFTSEQLAEIKTLAHDTRGLVLVTGPRGNGRTATLYALLRQHDAFTNSVQTLELNPQTEIEGVTINRFDLRSPDASFSKTLQSILLKDPNVVLVSQIPDSQTAEAIARYASGGETAEPRRVYSTLPAGDSFSALDLWLSLNSNRLEAVSALRMIIAQRLVRILCPICKIPYQPDESTMKRLNLPVGRNLQSFKANTEPIVDRKGNSLVCPDCSGVGFRGRSGIFEVLTVTEEIKKAVSSGATQNQIRLLARKNNLLLLVEHGIRKFATGITAINEVTRVMSVEKPGPGSGQSSMMPPQK